MGAAATRSLASWATVSDVARLRAFLGTRDRALVFLLLGTGIRLEEATRLRLGDVDLAHECVRVIGKGAKERKVYLSKVILKALLRYMAFRKPEPEALWLSEERRPLTKRGIQQILHKLGKRSGVTGVRVSAHTFRHTFAVNFLRAGGTLRHFQEVLGHANMDALEFYLRMVDNEDAMEARKHLDPLTKMGVS